MVLKSDGSGLYATKDLALAKRKFDEFQIDQSIYIVDAAQTLHFKQVRLGTQQQQHALSDDGRTAGTVLVSAVVRCSSVFLFCLRFSPSSSGVQDA